MIAFIVDQIISPFWPYILAAGGFVVAFLTGRMGGAAKAKRKQAEARVETMKDANEVRDAVDAKSDAAVRGDLGKWVRPE